VSNAGGPHVTAGVDPPSWRDEERDRAERIAAMRARIGLDVRERQRSQAETQRYVETIKEVCQRLGHDFEDPDTRRVVGEAVIDVMGNQIMWQLLRLADYC
jgi:hypothetical protein